jgi:hypothetical protein
MPGDRRIRSQINFGSATGIARHNKPDTPDGIDLIARPVNLMELRSTSNTLQASLGAADPPF